MLSKNDLVGKLVLALQNHDWPLSLRTFLRLLKKPRFGNSSAITIAFFLSRAIPSLSDSHRHNIFKSLKNFPVIHVLVTLRCLSYFHEKNFTGAVKLILTHKHYKLEVIKCLAFYGLSTHDLATQGHSLRAISVFRRFLRKHRSSLNVAVCYAHLLAERQNHEILENFSERFVEANPTLLGAHQLKWAITNKSQLPSELVPFWLCGRGTLRITGGDYWERIEDRAHYLSFRENMADLEVWKELLRDLSEVASEKSESVVFERWWHLLHFCGSSASLELSDIKKQVLLRVEELADSLQLCQGFAQ